MIELDEHWIGVARRIAEKAARSFFRHPFRDDLISAGLEAAVRAARDFESPQTDLPLVVASAFGAYLGSRVKGAVWDEVRRVIFKRNSTRVLPPLSLDLLCVPVEGGDTFELVDWQCDIAERVADALLLDYLLRNLGDDRRTYILSQRLCGRSQGELAGELGLSTARISQIEADTHRRARELALV